ncbi:MAG: reverse transcriptase domain-containing protein [Candidatus Saccharimonadales bacterium]
MKHAASRLETISDKKHLKAAWNSLKRNKLSKGIDRITIQQFKSELDSNLQSISDELRSKSGYKFSKVRGVAIPKEFTGKKRPIRIATVRDRVVQKAIELNIHPLLEEKYGVDNKVSYAYIKDKGLLKAVSRVSKFISEGNNVCYKGDIKDFFGTIKRDKLLNEMVFPALGTDTSLNRLIEDSLTQELGNIKALRKKHGTKEFSELFPDLEYGIPQGAILSPLFSNIYLKDFDKALSKFNLVRYADDFVILCKNFESALESDKIARVEAQKLDLEIYPLQARTVLKLKRYKSKSYVCESNDFEFLGMHFKNQKLYPSTGAFKKTGSKIRSVLKDKKYAGRSLGYKLATLERICASWASTYWFTSVDKVMKSGYYNLNQAYTNTIESIIEQFGLSFKHPYRRFDKKLKALGLSKFETKLQTSKDKVLANPAKKDLKDLFF